jgi:hypothetical protein
VARRDLHVVSDGGEVTGSYLLLAGTRPTVEPQCNRTYPGRVTV